MTHPTNLTANELERWAYIQNDGLTARLAGEADALEAQVELLDQDDQGELIAKLEDDLAERDGQIDDLRARIADLEELLGS
jgi:peptidoglycan hydrolase CwlO-like protein